MTDNISLNESMTVKNISEFEEMFFSWGKKNTNLAVILFDESEFLKTTARLFGPSHAMLYGTIFEISSTGNRQMALHDLVFEWKNLGDDKCVLKYIFTREQQHLVYEAPTSWKNAEFICYVCDKI